MTPRIRKILLWFFPGPGLTLLVFIYLTVVSWQRWADPIIDFGQQAYLPWVLSEGAVLYRDVDDFHGPLAAYVHALLFYLFGPGIVYLAVFNLILIVLTAILLNAFLKHLAPAPAARLGQITFVGAFAFACHRGWAGLNFVTPYVYDLTYGVMLSFAALYLFVWDMDRLRPQTWLAIGLVWGLAFLTKVEVFVALSASLMFGLVAWHYAKSIECGRCLRNGMLIAVGWVIPFACFLLYFAVQMPLGDAVQSLLSPYARVFHPGVKKIAFYSSILGTSSLGESLAAMGVHLSAFLIVGYTLHRINRAFTLPENRIRTFQIAAVVTTLAGLWALYPLIPWLEITRSFPLALIVIFALGAARFFKSENRRHFVLTHLPFWVLMGFALAMTLKVILNLKMHHIGFALALPATLAMIVLVFGCWLPRVDPAPPARSLLQPVIYAAFLFTIGVFVHLSSSHYAHKTFPVGRGPDMIYDYTPRGKDHTGHFITRGLVLQYAMEWLDARMKPTDTLLTLPDAMMLNYQLKRRFPTRDTAFNPLAILLDRELAMLARLKQSLPDYVALVHADHSHFGFPFFGKNYGTALNQWVQTEFERVQQIGPPPFTQEGFGISIYKRRTGP
ncbi:glycosyltransferase family 39 protein [Nitrospina gracilis]|uniref:glycosyltransferase family 39 protein n=1 Tax=Nitrospina gracilis TaxID=35801 RepID=UPI001F1E250B|nr:glycosyltransferase family 39 protein [Nitrospina gracilis]MCF8721673.1 hypothetical protein [Nitrospina gracilis Nb-211]